LGLSNAAFVQILEYILVEICLICEPTTDISEIKHLLLSELVNVSQECIASWCHKSWSNFWA